MVQRIDRATVQALMDDGAQLVEVLPASQYQHIHIEGALSIPLEEIGRRASGELDSSRAVIVYCYDYQ